MIRKTFPRIRSSLLNTSESFIWSQLSVIEVTQVITENTDPLKCTFQRLKSQNVCWGGPQDCLQSVSLSQNNLLWLERSMAREIWTGGIGTKQGLIPTGSYHHLCECARWDKHTTDPSKTPQWRGRGATPLPSLLPTCRHYVKGARHLLVITTAIYFLKLS